MSIYALPRKKKFPLGSKKQAISAVAYAVKLARPEYKKITPQERDIVLRKVHSRYPSINISPIRRRKK
jgi:acyl-CoA reductase-like NAD-dependent aldehyde dehydrogenase